MDKLVANMRRSIGGGQIDLMADIIEKLHLRVKALEEQLSAKVTTAAQAKASTPAKGK